MKIKSIKANQVFDSRANPTVEAIINNTAKAIAPSGKSTGIYEAKEVRDNKKDYFYGKSVENAIKAIKRLSPKLKKTNTQRQFDTILKDNIDKIGSNGAIALSMAYARLSKNLISYLNKQTKTKITTPVIMANVINGGVHAKNKLKFQEFMITPIKAKDQVQAIAEIYHILKKQTKSYSLGDEGGLSIKNIDEKKALAMIEKAISKSSFTNKQIRIALDVAASEFYRDEYYYLNKRLSAQQLMDYYKKIIKDFKIYSIEDAFEQTDYVAWKEFTKKNKKLLIVGDDLTVSNKIFLQKAINNKLCNSIILKPNQVGTVTDSIETIRLANKNKFKLIASHRSGDTEDAFIVDFAFAMGAKHMKIGAPCRGERTAKYNRFIELTK